jgi:hypothetical protein
LLDIVDGSKTQKILNGEATGFETLWTVEELWRLPSIVIFANLADVLNGTFV